MLNTRQFTCVKRDKMLLADDSDSSKGGTIDYLVQIYPDSIDPGFSMASQNTGVNSDWALDWVETSDDGIVYWEYVPTDETKRKVPALRLS